MTTRWHDLHTDGGPLGALEIDPIPGFPALELHLWQRDEAGSTTAVWLDDHGIVLRVVRPGVA